MKRILLADDNSELRTMMQEWLEDAGYHVDTAANGLEVLEQQTRMPADLVITDMCMPKVDGLETIVALRRQDPGIKIIAISGDDGDHGRNYLRAAESFGAVRSFAKPVRSGDLLAAVRELMGATVTES